MANFAQNVVFAGLGTFSFNAPAAENIFVEGKISLPTISNGGGVSSCLVTINQNGSPVYVGQAGAEGFKVNLLVAANDLIAVVLSSAAPADIGLNVIKTTISMGSGE